MARLEWTESAFGGLGRRMTVGYRQAASRLSEEEFQALYGPWTAAEPAEIAELLAGCGARWHIAGGRAARAGTAPRRHEDTDIAVLAAGLDALRAAMDGWHLWENVGGEFRPLLPGIAVRPECGQLWVRRDARSPWRFEFLIDRLSTETEWVFKRDERVRLPWERAVHTVDGIPYLRPEVALLFKAKQDREKDREDLRAARLSPEGRAWLVRTLGLLGYHEWARLAEGG